MIVATPDLMVDTETLGTRPGSALTSIGAVAFNAEEGYVGAGFYCTVDARSCERAGLTLDADTVLWWLKQSGEARAALTAPGAMDLSVALAGLASFWLSQGCRRVWSHGANFDEPLLSAAYRAAGMAGPPWKYWDARCTRTLFALAGVAPDREGGTHHNALDDALAQARAAIEAYRKLGLAVVATETREAAE